jgi:hypothetical protein
MLPFAPPTDSLYKFLALSGLALCIVALWVPLREADRINGEMPAFSAESDLLAEQARLRTGSGSTVPSVDALDNERERQHARKEKELEIRTAAWKAQTAWYGKVLAVGVLAAVIGFTLWWFRVQRYQDQLARSQAEEAHLKVEELRAKEANGWRSGSE